MLVGCYTPAYHYNTSLGQDASVRYKSQNTGSNATGEKYRYYEFQSPDTTRKPAKPVETAATDTLPPDSAKSFTVVERVEWDTTIDKTVEKYKEPIRPEEKDSLLFALIRDKSLTDEQREQRMKAFVESHVKERTILDTVVRKRVSYDTVYHAASTPQIEEKIDSLSNTIDDNAVLQRKIDSLARELETMKRQQKEKEANSKVPEFNESELYSMGYRHGKARQDGGKAFWSVFLPGITALVISGMIPLVSLMLFFGSFAAFTYYMVSPPSIDWNRVSSKHRDSASFRNGYVNAVVKNIRKNAWFGLIPNIFSLSLIILALLIFIFLTTV